MPRRRPSSASLLLALALLGLPSIAVADACPAPGEWQRDGQPIASDTLMRDLASAQVVLLGEQHARLAHHRWQLHTLAALHAHHPQMVIGLEMLPREAQPALDAWVAGELDEAEFLTASGWQEAWGFDPELYLPILHFARMHRLPLVALNVTPELRGRLAEGWETVPAAQRHAITPPAPASDAYRETLGEVYALHPSEGEHAAGLERFVAAQLVWDRAMAAGLAEAAGPDTLVVGLMGQGHVTFGHGVPHQLDDLGIRDHTTLLPWSLEQGCTPPEGIADALFTLGDEQGFEPPAPKRLGVMIGTHEAGLQVMGIVPDSLADQLGLREGDVITAAAGQRLESPGDLTALVRRQPPGTLLPLTVERDGVSKEWLARFPVAAP